MTIHSLLPSDPNPPGPAAIRPEHLYKFAGLLFLFALLFRYFEVISRVFLIVYAAAILGVALNALVRRVPLQRQWKAGIIGIVIIAAFGAAVWFGGSALLRQLSGLLDSLPQMREELTARAEEWSSVLGFDLVAMGQRLGEQATDVFSSLSGGDLVGRAGGLLEAFTVPVLIFFGGLFALAHPNDHLLVPFLRTVPTERRAAFRRFFELLGERVTGWLQGTVVSMTTIGVLAAVAFWLLGVPYALLLGVINGVAEFVPIVGPWVGGIPAVVIAFLDDPIKGAWTAVAILGIQQVESQLVTPIVMSKAADVPPFITLFSIVLFGGLFGFLGILLALPLVLLIWTAIQVLWVERAIHTGSDKVAPVVDE